MLDRASSTARVIDLHCVAGNPRVSVNRSTAPRTTVSSLGLLCNANINSRPPRGHGFGSSSLLMVGRGEIFVCDMGRLLREVVSSSEIPAKEPDLTFHILFQERLAL
jgi:hypothetical protein